jgi:alkylation response protein AidB-like acyl-CoA dehydrogenase
VEFAFTEEQGLLRESAVGFLSENSNSKKIREAMESSLVYDQKVWQKMSEEMGWLALLIPEEYDGLGLTWIELTALLEQMGYFLLCSPFHSTICLGATCLLEFGNEDQKTSFLPRIVNGSLQITLACLEQNGDWSPNGITSTYKKIDNEFIVSGIKKYVPYGHSADKIIVIAREEGSNGAEGVSLFLVDSEEKNLEIKKLNTMDQTRPQSLINLNKVRISDDCVLGELGGGWNALEKLRLYGALGVSAEQVGGAQRCLDMTCDFVLEREQFGRKIGSFQSIKHRLADMMVLVESARSASYYASCMTGANSQEFEETVSIAKSYCSEAFFKCAGDAIQLHGGVGFTWEYDAHLFFKRAKSSEIYFGDPSFHKSKISNILGL